MRPDVKLLLPEVLYAVEGVEFNIYFANIVTVININNYAFEVEFPYGRCDAKRFRWTPEADQCGEHPIILTVWDDYGIAAQAERRIIVSPADAGKDTTLTILQIGASCMSAAGHGEALHKRFQKPGNPCFTMLGSHAPGYKPVEKGGPANEAYGGWTWRTFFEKTKSNHLSNDGLHPARPYDVPSPFLFQQDGEFKFDFARYLETVCGGVKPDVIEFELGVNGIFGVRTDEEFEERWKESVYPFMKRMMEECRRVLPDVILGVELIPRGAASQDAFGKSYKCTQSRRRWMCNADLLFRKYIACSSEMDYYIIPGYHNFDTEQNYPVLEDFIHAETLQKTVRQNNALHPSVAGYEQWADNEYAFFKYIVSRKGK